MHTENMIPQALQPEALLIAPKALAQHLRTLVDNDPSTRSLTLMNTCLLDQIQTEAIPSSIFHIWLPLVSQHSSHFVPAALRDPSCGVRRAGIKVVQRCLFRGPHWKAQGWDMLGGAEGIKDILEGLPLAEVPLLIKAISARSASFGDKQVVLDCFEEFVALVEDMDTWTKRSLSHQVSVLHAFCTTERVTKLLRSQKSIPSIIFTNLCQFHTPLLRYIAIGAIQVPGDVRRNVLKLCRNSLLLSEEAYVPIHLNDRPLEMPPGLLFGMDLLLVMRKESVLQNDKEIHGWVESIIGQAIRKKLPLPSIVLILNSSLELCRLRDPSKWLSRSLPRDVIQFWSIARFGRSERSRWCTGLAKMFQRRRRSEFTEAHKISLEQCMIQQVLQVKDDDFIIDPRPARFKGALVSLLNFVPSKGTLEFLQLLCRHSPNLSFDLTAWPPTEKERQILPFWDSDILQMLPPDRSKLLFKRSLHIYRCEEFLPDLEIGEPPSWAISWRAQCFLWEAWEASAVNRNGDFPVTRNAIEGMKQRAANAREPAVRLQWAESALTLAWKTQSPDIFLDVVKWSKRFLRDPLVYPRLIVEIFGNGGFALSCWADLQATKTGSQSHLLEVVQKVHETLTDLLETSLLLLREPWARSSVGKLTKAVPEMFSSIASYRMKGIRELADVDFITESELVKVLLDPLIPIFIDYEREGNAEGQTDVGWNGLSRLATPISCPRSPSPAELSFMDRLMRSRNEFWEQHRARTNPDVFILDAGWPRGLPIQYLVRDKSWLYYALKRPDEAPYLSSRVNEVLFGSIDTIMAVVPKNTEPIGCFVDSLWFVISALIEDGESADKARDILRIWEYYSSKLQAHSLSLQLFQDWLWKNVAETETAKSVGIIQPPSFARPTVTVSAVPTGSEIIEWDPQNGDDDVAEVASRNESETPEEVPCTILHCRMQGKLPANSRSVTMHLQPIPKPFSLWLFAGNSPQAESRDASADVRDSIVLSALLFLDSYTQNPRILRTQFPDVKHPRYTPIYLADELIARVTKARPRDTLEQPITALRKCAKRVPARILRDLIWSFLDTLKVKPNASTYSDLLFCTFDLIQVLLSSDQPHLAVDVMLRVWKEFAHESSNHRKISLVKMGRILRPEQASEMMRRLAGYVCDTQQRQAEANTVVIKVTTVKILAQVLAVADFLPESTRMHILQNMFNVSRHIDVRREIVASILALVSVSDSLEPYRVFASIALSVAGPNERSCTTEEDWISVESGGGPLPSVATCSERPVLSLVVHTAARQIPERLRSGYARHILLPLVQESGRQHMRWMTLMASILGLSISDLGITESEIGPFSLDLVDTILGWWTKYLPVTYLQHHHRPWSLSYLHFASFDRIAQALAETTDSSLKGGNVQGHWNEFLESQRGRLALFDLKNILFRVLKDPSDDFKVEMAVEDFCFRAEARVRNPVRYNYSLGKYEVYPAYTLEILRDLRNGRVKDLQCLPLGCAAIMYDQTTEVMRHVIDASERVRREGWSNELATAYPMTLPTAFEYDTLMLPSPLYNPMASKSNSTVNIFISSVIELIRKYATDSVLLLKLDFLQSVVKEVALANMATCALRLGCIQQGQNNVVELCVRVKLACILLSNSRKTPSLLDGNIQEMIEEWKKSGIEIVRQLGWECERMRIHRY